MHLDKDATKQKDFFSSSPEVKALLPPLFTLHEAGKCGMMLMEVSGSHHKLVLFLFLAKKISIQLLFPSLFIQLQICPQIFCVLAH